MSPGLGTAGSTLCTSRRCLSGSCPQAHLDLPQFAELLPCSLPTSVCPAHCPASIWDTSVAPQPLIPVELDKTATSHPAQLKVAKGHAQGHAGT